MLACYLFRRHMTSQSTIYFLLFLRYMSSTNYLLFPVSVGMWHQKSIIHFRSFGMWRQKLTISPPVPPPPAPVHMLTDQQYYFLTGNVRPAVFIKMFITNPCDKVCIQFWWKGVTKHLGVRFVCCVILWERGEKSQFFGSNPLSEVLINFVLANGERKLYFKWKIYR